MKIPKEKAMKRYSKVDLCSFRVRDCSFSYGGPPPDIYRLTHGSYTLGYVTPRVVLSLRQLQASPDQVSQTFELDDDRRTLTICGADAQERSANAATLVQKWRDQQAFELIHGWRNELYPAYGKDRAVLFNIERAASALLGIVTYGVHMTAYVRIADGFKFWIPKRRASKPTYGGMFDNTVAGGLDSGETPLTCLIREAEEEASFPEDLIRNHAKPCGTVTYFTLRDKRAGGETGLFQPECEYVYDLELDSTLTPKPNDGEVEGFELMSLKEVQDAMSEGRFKPNCALVLLDFFIRHGILTAEAEPGYVEIVARLHRRFDFPTA